MGDSVSAMLAQIGSNASNPPLHLWNPELSGDIDIRIAANGDWYHEGVKIQRQQLVHLFSSILRYEPDIGYVLVTPVEKWRIEVEDAPFIAIALSVRQQEHGAQQLWFATNTGQEFCLGDSCNLVLQGEADKAKPYILFAQGLSARLSQNVYYQLSELVEHIADEFFVSSCNQRFPLG